jgi:hypothetical protein
LGTAASIRSVSSSWRAGSLALGKAVAVIGRPHLLTESLESRSVRRSDLRVHSVEKREAGQQVLTRRPLTTRVLAVRAARSTDRLIERQGVQPSQQVTHDGELLDELGAVGQRRALNEPGD